ncbi:acetolactate synthase 2 small subunit [Rheinheimera sp. SA_1]|uniref:acetolactate synthase 2 small subunit n=1 Tax=Rheinheimera sp. SA_1 TaxID=1827365 RepID=UPI000AD104A4|nr:acetolactate synthase 2 small subunit [Rheinheimera sp. SA_1]
MSTNSMSTQHTLTIQTGLEVVAVERLLQVTRYRGFQLCGLEMKPMADNNGLLVTLNILSDKPISLLTAQLNKLYDVQHLELHAPAAAVLRA